MKTYTIGRNPSSDIVLTANFCSRDHAKITINKSGGVLLQDFSRNGTIVNGKSICNQTIEIKQGDEVFFAGVEQLDWSKIEIISIQMPDAPKSNPSSNPISPNPFANKLGIKITLGFILLLAITAIIYFNFHQNSEPKILSANEIYERYKNAVALVEVKYYIRIHTKANDLYFGLGDDEKIDFNKDKSALNPLTSEGTAFFIDNSGKLITNLHVIEPWSYNKELKNYFFTKVAPTIKNILRKKGWGNDEPNFYGELESINIYPNGKTFSTENSIGCTVYKESTDADIDLASLQTNSHVLPQNVSCVSSAEIQTDERKIQVGSPAFVIGFPHGDALAQDEDNILNCTSTQGNFTQTPAKNYIQYSAQTASGGSGSPVFNEYGNLVAVTYLGSSTGQSFNRGILAKHIKTVFGM